MGAGKIIGFAVLFLLWLWLAYAVLAAGGINLKNLFVVVASGIIVFVPIWKKYFKK